MPGDGRQKSLQIADRGRSVFVWLQSWEIVLKKSIANQHALGVSKVPWAGLCAAAEALLGGQRSWQFCG